MLGQIRVNIKIQKDVRFLNKNLCKNLYKACAPLYRITNLPIDSG